MVQACFTGPSIRGQRCTPPPGLRSWRWRMPTAAPHRAYPSGYKGSITSTEMRQNVNSTCAAHALVLRLTHVFAVLSNIRYSQGKPLVGRPAIPDRCCSDRHVFHCNTGGLSRPTHTSNGSRPQQDEPERGHKSHRAGFARIRTYISRTTTPTTRSAMSSCAVAAKDWPASIVGDFYALVLTFKR